MKSSHIFARKHRAAYRFLAVIVALACFAQAGAVQALTYQDLHDINSSSTWYNPKDTATTNCASKSGGLPASVNLPQPIIEGINAHKAVYEAVAQEKDVPWPLIAALHYRETSFNSTTNPSNGQGIYQLFSLYQQGQRFAPGPITPDEFKRQTGLAVDFFLSKQGANLPNHRDRITQATAEAETIKDTFFSYNGRSGQYAQQAATYGFNATTQPYEGSPYVMNKFDEPRQSMRMISRDNGPVDAVDSRYGAFTIYAALGGLSGSSSTCQVSGDAIVDVAAAELNKGVKEEPDGSDTGPEITKYTDNVTEAWCADFISWVYKTAGKPFTGGLSGGWRISSVITLADYLASKGEYTLRTDNRFPPQPGDIVIFSGEVAPGGDASRAHAGLVYSVNGNTITTIEGNALNKVMKLTYDSYQTNGKITGWGRPR